MRERAGRHHDGVLEDTWLVFRLSEYNGKLPELSKDVALICVPARMQRRRSLHRIRNRVFVVLL